MIFDEAEGVEVALEVQELELGVGGEIVLLEADFLHLGLEGLEDGLPLALLIMHLSKLLEVFGVLVEPLSEPRGTERDTFRA